jgi:DNA-binding transcriptional MerR regulator
MKDFFTIGELADLFAIDVQTLRYYDKIGLLIPSHRNHANGYRLYKFDQVYQVASIRYLKRLGYSLEQIREYLDSRTLFSSNVGKNLFPLIQRFSERLSLSRLNSPR